MQDLSGGNRRLLSFPKGKGRETPTLQSMRKKTPPTIFWLTALF
jgi:hypothetical protein